MGLGVGGSHCLYLNKNVMHKEWKLCQVFILENTTHSRNVAVYSFLTSMIIKIIVKKKIVIKLMVKTTSTLVSSGNLFFK